MGPASMLVQALDMASGHPSVRAQQSDLVTLAIWAPLEETKSTVLIPVGAESTMMFWGIGDCLGFSLMTQGRPTPVGRGGLCSAIPHS